MASQSITGCQGIKVKWWKRCLPEVIGHRAGSRWCCWIGGWSTMASGWLAQRHIVTVVHHRVRRMGSKSGGGLTRSNATPFLYFCFLWFFWQKTGSSRTQPVNQQRKGNMTWHDLQLWYKNWVVFTFIFLYFWPLLHHPWCSLPIYLLQGKKGWCFSRWNIRYLFPFVIGTHDYLQWGPWDIPSKLPSGQR